MKLIKRTIWIGTFDRESFLAAILKTGLVVGLGLLIAGSLWQRQSTGHVQFERSLQGGNILQLLIDACRPTSALRWPQRFLHVGISVLILTPYARTLMSAWYFGYVERDYRYAIYSGGASLLLTYILLLR